MYKKGIYPKTTLEQTISTEGETIEGKLRRIKENNEPITDGAPLIYTDYEEGVKPQYDIRTDKMEMAMRAKDKVVRNELTRKAQFQQEKEDKIKKDSETEATGGTTTTEN